MTEEINQCPYKAKNISVWPDNTCIPKGSYCNWPCDHESCDTYKSRVRVIEMLLDIADKGKTSSNE